jgi:N6-L-threonylcarbamoyladenine synthase
MLVLGIETTCDETAAAVVRRAGDRGEILSNVVRAQIEEHAAFGGVVPEIAARAHIDALDGVVAQALRDAGVGLGDLDGVAAAAGPGLVGGVIVGLTAGKALSFVAGKPFVAVNHLEAHVLTPRLTHGRRFPYLALLVSGGHTQLLAVRGVGDYVRLGTTVDDALGEAFDKVAKMLGLPYPGGPQVELQARSGDPGRFAFPRPMLGRAKPDFSLSGLKTAVRLEAQKIAPLSPQDIADLCAGFSAAIVEMIIDRVRAGFTAFEERFGRPTTIVVVGGVAANRPIRLALRELGKEIGVGVLVTPIELCGDNGAMIAWAGLERLALGLSDPLDAPPRPRWPLDAAAALPGAKA